MGLQPSQKGLTIQNQGGERVFDPNSVAGINRETYNAWKSYWLSKGKTLADAVEYGRQQGGDEYAEKLMQIIDRMETLEILRALNNVKDDEVAIVLTSISLIISAITLIILIVFLWK